jgi:hypothetical protein
MSEANAALKRQSIDLLIRLLGGRFDTAHLPWIRIAGWDWRLFADLCERHGVTGLVFARLRNAPGACMPAPLFQHLQARFFEVASRNYVLAKRMVDLTRSLEENGIPVLPFKGPATAMLAYGDLALRQCDDLDLIVPEGLLSKTVEWMRGCGFEDVGQGGRPYLVPKECQPENPGHVAAAEEIPFRSPDRNYFVDLHWTLGHDYWRAFCPQIEMIWQRQARVELPTGSVSTLCREDLLLALCSHGTKHRWLCLKWLVDIERLLAAQALIDWSRIEELIRVRRDAGLALGVGLRLVEAIFDTPVPAAGLKLIPERERVSSVTASITKEILTTGQSSGSYLGTLLGLQPRRFTRWKIRADVARRYPAGVLREGVLEISAKDRAAVPLPDGFGFLYHVVRPVRLIADYAVRLTRSSF